MNGEVVGINSAKLASTAVEGIGYAIAISDVTDTLESLMNEETRDKLITTVFWESQFGVLTVQ